MFSRRQIITVRTIGSQLIGRLSGDSTFFLFVSLVLGSSTEPDINTKAVGGWLNRGLPFHRESSDGHSAKYNNVGSQRSNGKIGYCGQFLKGPVNVALGWAWFL